MANLTHLSEFLKGRESWKNFLEKNKREENEELDLSNKDFTDVEEFAQYLDKDGKLDYSGLNFSKCILNSSNFYKCNLQNTNFRKSKLLSTKFVQSSLQESCFDGATATDANFTLSEARGASFINTDLTSATLSSGTFSNCCFKRSIFNGTHIKGSDFHLSDFTGVDDFFKGWETNLVGTPKFPDYPATPVEFVIGLNPHTKKLISDGMYLQSVWNKSTGLSKLRLRLWGFSCGYGQSIQRWITLSIIIVAIFAFIYTNIEMSVSTPDIAKKTVSALIKKPDFITSSYYSVITFVTLGYGDIFPINTEGRVVAMIEVCIGYIMLGGLVSIFSNKLSRLS